MRSAWLVLFATSPIAPVLDSKAMRAGLGVGAGLGLGLALGPGPGQVKPELRLGVRPGLGPGRLGGRDGSDEPQPWPIEI